MVQRLPSPPAIPSPSSSNPETDIQPESELVTEVRRPTVVSEEPAMASDEVYESPDDGDTDYPFPGSDFYD